MKTTVVITAKVNNFSCRLILLLFTVIPIMPSANAQAISREEFKDSLSRVPYFSIHKDNYFITGIPTNTSINRSTSDAKYQISFKQMITRTALPWETYLFLTYSQKAFWDVYKESFPFREINFNPSVGVGRAIFGKDDRLNGIASLMYEHESNGRDSTFSRSWNRISLEYAARISSKITTRVKVWIPFAYQRGNPDILDYVGLGQIDFSYELKPNQIYFELMLRKGRKFDFKGAFRPRIYYNPFRNRSNQYFMLEWYVGQAENLMDYERSSSMVRIGYVIKSNELNILNGHHVP